MRMMGKFSLLAVTVTALALALGGLAGADELCPPSTPGAQVDHGGSTRRAFKSRK